MFFVKPLFAIATAALSLNKGKNNPNEMSASSSLAKAVTVKIVSDVVWPFCYIGLRHLEIASQNSGVKVNLEWMPFMLNPNMDEEGEDIKTHVTKKYGPSATKNFGDPDSHLMKMGRNVGINFNNDRMMVNTKRAHALVEHIKERGENDKANDFMVDLYKSYFEDGENINDEAFLIQKAKNYGVDENEAKLAMGEHNLQEITNKDRKVKSMYGISGVPFYMIHPNDGGTPVGFSGAYPPEVIAEQLQEAADA